MLKCCNVQLLSLLSIDFDPDHGEPDPDPDPDHGPDSDPNPDTEPDTGPDEEMHRAISGEYAETCM